MGNDGSQSNDSDTGDYIDLPNGLVSKLTQMTVSVWATYTDQDLAIWSRVLSFGVSDGGEDRSPSGGSSTYVTIQPNRSGNVAGIEYRNSGAVNEFTLDGRVPLDEEIMYTLVHDDIAGTAKLYLNGVVQNGIPTNVTPKEFNDINVWLGRGQWNDPLFVGSFNECRMYDTVMSAEDIVASYLAGPDALPVPPEPCDLVLAGDVNHDCVVDVFDTAILADRWLTQSLED
jgi:concanavalin A-like lectin/glucanase superfamily protein